MAKNKRYVFTPYITIKGVRIYASDYGKKAFRIEVRDWLQPLTFLFS